MTRVEFQIVGSQGDLYDVAFEVGEGIGRASCTCQAGMNRQFCKHRTALLDGEISSLRSANATHVAELKALLEGTDLAIAYAQVLTATKAHEETKRSLDAAKKQLARISHS